VRRRLLAALALSAIGGGAGCTVGDGSGEVKSSKLYVKDCWDGEFDLKPDFFAANPYREEALLIRIQRGDNNQEASDGLTVIVNDLAKVQSMTDGDNPTPIPVGLPPGVAPPGQPLTGEPAPLVTLSLYLHQTCHEQNSAIYSVGGTIEFKSIFSGDPNEKNSQQRLTEASFLVDFADPRELLDAEKPSDLISSINGSFKFFFQRGQPAQPFQ
jgi:hypothetical protein